MTSLPVMFPAMFTSGGYGMNRRGFLGMFFKGAAYLPLMPVATMVMLQRKVIMQQSPLSGSQYHEGGRIFDHLHVGAPLTLEREPGNKYDCNILSWPEGWL